MKDWVRTEAQFIVLRSDWEDLLQEVFQETGKISKNKRELIELRLKAIEIWS